MVSKAMSFALSFNKIGDTSIRPTNAATTPPKIFSAFFIAFDFYQCKNNKF
jgi:hypothetical protein